MCIYERKKSLYYDLYNIEFIYHRQNIENFEQNATINFEPIFEKNAKSDRIFEKTINFENFVNGR